jgi:hypothetical protein
MRVIDALALARKVPAARVEYKEADLEGALCSLYFLGNPMVRVAVDLAAYRTQVVAAVEEACGLFVALNNLPLFRPCPVISLKPCFADVTCPYRMRLVLDLDYAHPGADCDVRGLVDAVQFFLGANTTGGGDWCTARVFVFEGRFADKPRSLHMYFPDYCFANGHDNLAKKDYFNPLNKVLDAYGLKCDPAPFTCGLKLPFADKKTKEGPYRGVVQQLVYVRGVPDVSVITYDQLFEACWPAMLSGDTCAGEVRWIARTVTLAREPVQKRARTVVQVEEADGPESRLRAGVPGWADAQFKTTRKGHLTVLVPLSSHCPLKHEPSSDCPAYTHGSPGKAYAVIGVLGEMTVRCHICVGSEVSLPPAAGEQLSELEQRVFDYFKDYVRCGHDRVLHLPKTELISKTAFQHTHARAAEEYRISIGPKRFQSWPDYWYEHDRTPRFINGMTFDPDPNFNDPESFNVYEGVDAALLRHAYEEEAYLDTLMYREWDETFFPRIFSLIPHWTQMLLHNVCGGDPKCFLYFHQWMAYTVQYPHKKPRVALVLVGAPGAGKGRSVDPIKKIFGKASIVIESLNTKYTADYNHSIILHYDEAAGEDGPFRDGKAAHAMLKRLITEEGPSMTRQIYQASELTRNYAHVVVTANSRDAVFWQPGERRFMAFECAHRVHPQNSTEGREFFAAVAREVETLSHVFYHLWSKMEVTDFQPEDTPFNRGMFVVQYSSMEPVEKFLYQVLLTGHLHKDPLDNLSTQDTARIEAVLTEARRLNPRLPERTAENAGFGVFCAPRFGEAHFKGLWTMGFQRMYPDARNAEQTVWRFLNEFNKNAQQPLFETKQIRVGGDKRAYVFILKQEVSVWRQEFEASRGKLSSSIWEEDAIRA